MKFGVNVNVHYPADIKPSVILDSIIQQARTARDGGFDGIFAAHHLAAGPTECFFQPMTLLARLAGEVPGMTMGTCIFLLSLYNPVEAAELSANLDLITGGRFAFGVGQGYRDVEFQSFGVSKRHRGARLEEAVKLIRRLWSEDNVSAEGKHFPMHGVTINPKPVQRAGPPIWVGGDTLAAVTRAARVGDTWMCSPRHSKSFIREALQVFREERQRVGLAVPPPVFFRELFLAPTREQALQSMKHAFERLYGVYHREGQPGERYDRSFEELEGERVIAGSPDDVAQEIKTYQEEFGAEYMFFRVYYLGMELETGLNSIRLFGEKVIPQFV